MQKRKNKKHTRYGGFGKVQKDLTNKNGFQINYFKIYVQIQFYFQDLKKNESIEEN